MRKLIIIAAILLAGCSSTSTKKDNPHVEDVVHSETRSRGNTVYICNSATSKVYHRTSSCRGLSRCRSEIIEVDIEDAKEDKRACKICY